MLCPNGDIFLQEVGMSLFIKSFAGFFLCAALPIVYAQSSTPSPGAEKSAAGGNASTKTAAQSDHATDNNSGAGKNSAKNKPGSDTVTVEVPVVVLVPMQVRTNPNLVGGCWVRLFDGTNFKGRDELTIAGPIQMQSLTMPSGIKWSRRADSLIVGPKATVQVYGGALFKDKNLTFKADEKVPSLRKELGFLHSIDSLKITCAS
jgi:hypothetical protein